MHQMVMHFGSQHPKMRLGIHKMTPPSADYGLCGFCGKSLNDQHFHNIDEFMHGEIKITKVDENKE